MRRYKNWTSKNIYLKTCSASFPRAQSASFLLSTLNSLQGVMEIISCSSTLFNPSRGAWQVPVCYMMKKCMKTTINMVFHHEKDLTWPLFVEASLGRLAHVLWSMKEAYLKPYGKLWNQRSGYNGSQHWVRLVDSGRWLRHIHVHAFCVSLSFSVLCILGHLF